MPRTLSGTGGGFSHGRDVTDWIVSIMNRPGILAAVLLAAPSVIGRALAL